MSCDVVLQEGAALRFIQRLQTSVTFLLSHAVFTATKTLHVQKVLLVVEVKADAQVKHAIIL